MFSTTDRILPTDILCGKTKAFRTHEGNKVFKAIIDRHLPRYLEDPSRNSRRMVVGQVLSYLRDEIGVRFLKMNDHGSWTVLNPIQSREKIGHTFRDATRALKQQHKTERPAPFPSLSSSLPDHRSATDSHKKTTKTCQDTYERQQKFLLEFSRKTNSSSNSSNGEKDISLVLANDTNHSQYEYHRLSVLSHPSVLESIRDSLVGEHNNGENCIEDIPECEATIDTTSNNNPTPCPQETSMDYKDNDDDVDEDTSVESTNVPPLSRLSLLCQESIAIFSQHPERHVSTVNVFVEKHTTNHEETTYNSGHLDLLAGN